MKKVGIVLVVVVLLLILGFVIQKDFVYEKSITVNVPAQSAWQHVNSLSALDRWSPWNEYDPTMEKELTGTDGTVGAKQSWESDVENVGKGTQTIAVIDAPSLFQTDLKFEEPFESEAKAYVKLKEDNGATTITWGFESQMPILLMVFMDMEGQMGKDWDNGLQKLKTLCEQS